MLPDRNKSELTHTLTEAAFQWLDNHGFKPVETEVPMPWPGVGSVGWVADLAGVIVPTQTELIEMKMIPRPPRFSYNGKNDGYEERYARWSDLYRSWRRTMTCLVEVKIARGDYLADRKWRLTPPTDLAFVAVPSGMVKQEEWPEGWGVLELRGAQIVKTRNPIPRVATTEEHLDVIYQIALRRDHRTRHAQARERQKEERMEQTVRVSMDRLDRVIDAVRDIVAGATRWGEKIDSAEQALRIHGVRNAGPRQLERLGELFGIAARLRKETPCNSPEAALQ